MAESGIPNFESAQNPPGFPVSGGGGGRNKAKVDQLYSPLSQERRQIIFLNFFWVNTAFLSCLLIIITFMRYLRLIFALSLNSYETADHRKFPSYRVSYQNINHFTKFYFLARVYYYFIYFFASFFQLSCKRFKKIILVNNQVAK